MRMTRGNINAKLDGKPWFAEIQKRHLRQIQEEGGHLIQRRDDGEWVRISPDGTETLLGYRDEK